MDPAKHAGKTMLITEGASGIGRATALLFAREGAPKICLVDRARDRLDDGAAELKEAGAEPHTVTAELTDGEQCHAAVREAADSAGRLDIVVSNAGWARQDRFVDISPEVWDATLAINLSAHFHVAQQ